MVVRSVRCEASAMWWPDSRYKPNRLVNAAIDDFKVTWCLLPGMKYSRKGTTTTYIPVINPALPAVTVTRAICCNTLPVKFVRPHNTPQYYSSYKYKSFDKTSSDSSVYECKLGDVGYLVELACVEATWCIGLDWSTLSIEQYEWDRSTHTFSSVSSIPLISLWRIGRVITNITTDTKYLHALYVNGPISL